MSAFNQLFLWTDMKKLVPSLMDLMALIFLVLSCMALIDGCNKTWGQSIHPSTCKITIPDSDGAYSQGSGTLTDLATQRGNAVIASAAHVFADRRTNICKITFPSGLSLSGKLFHCDRPSDVAFIAVVPSAVKTITRTLTARALPTVGVKIHVEGYGYKGVGFSEGQVRSLRYMANGVPLLASTASVIPGDSGGPVRNDRGELVSIVSCSGENYAPNDCTGPRTDVVWRQARIAGLRQLYCPDGTCPQYQPAPQYQIAPQYQSPPQYDQQPTPAPIPMAPAPQQAPIAPQATPQPQQQPVVTPSQIEVIVTQKPGEDGPPGPEGPPGPQGAIGPQGPQGVAGRSPTAAEIAKQISLQLPESLRVQIHDDKTGDVLFSQTYPIRGNTGIVDVDIPYDRSGFGQLSGQFQIQVP